MRLPRRKRRVAPKERYDVGRTPTPGVDLLGDEDLRALNELLPWHCFTVDQHGRPFGKPAWEGKRSEPQRVPDPRIELFHERFDLSDKHVLEVGSFEGVHTVALCERARSVTAIDGRIENVVKTMVRCAFFDRHPKVLTYDLERTVGSDDNLRADVCHHMGVLYHLTDPVRHLLQLGSWVSRGLMLDTHYVHADDADREYEADGERFRYRRFGESRADPFSGMETHSKWLLLDDIERILEMAGFGTVDVVENRDERNGPRVLLFAEKTPTLESG